MSVELEASVWFEPGAVTHFAVRAVDDEGLAADALSNAASVELPQGQPVIEYKSELSLTR